DGLIGGNKDESFNAKSVGGLCGNPRPHAIVLQCLGRIQLHEWDMLVRGCMENDGGAVLVQDRAQSTVIGDITNNRMHKGGSAAITQLFRNCIQTVLMTFIQDE